MKKFIVWCIASLLLLVSCAPSGSGTVNDHAAIPKRLLSFASAWYASVAYVDDRLIAFTYASGGQPNGSSSSVDISYAYENGRQLYPFGPGPDPICKPYLRYYVMGQVLPDGRLGLLKDCGDASLRGVRSIYAYDWQTQQLTRIMHENLWDPRVNEFTWNPQMTRGVQAMGNGLTGTIYWINPDGTLPMNVEIQDQGLTWNLRSYFEGQQNGVGIAKNPAWSPDGKSIAFFASNYGTRETPSPWDNIRFELYFMDPSILQPVQVLIGITDAGVLRWSPDSKRLAFVGCIGWQVECGLWLFDIGGKVLTLVDSGDYFGDVTWIGNTKLAAIRDSAVVGDPNQIWEYSLPTSVAP